MSKIWQQFFLRMVHFSEKINKDISVSIGIQNLVIGDLKGKTALGRGCDNRSSENPGIAKKGGGV